MTASTPPLVDIIKVALRVHVKQNIKGCDCGWAELGKDHRDHQARAVLDALEQAEQAAHYAATAATMTPEEVRATMGRVRARRQASR